MRTIDFSLPLVLFAHVNTDRCSKTKTREIHLFPFVTLRAQFKSAPHPFLSGIVRFMPKEIKAYFSKSSSYADKRKEALEKRKKLLDELRISDVSAFSIR